MKQSQHQERGMSGLQLLLGAVIVMMLLAILLEIIVQFLPPHYSPLSQPESDLAVGPYGFLEATSFFLRGLLTLVFMVAFVRGTPQVAQSRRGLMLLGASAIGKLIIAFAATDLTPRPATRHGMVHALAAVISFLCGAWGQWLLARSLRYAPHVHPSRRVLFGLASVSFVWAVITIGTLGVSAQIGVWGMLERIATLLFLAWLLLVTLGLWHRLTVEKSAESKSNLAQGVT